MRGADKHTARTNRSFDQKHDAPSGLRIARGDGRGLIGREWSVLVVGDAEPLLGSVEARAARIVGLVTGAPEPIPTITVGLRTEGRTGGLFEDPDRPRASDEMHMSMSTSREKNADSWQGWERRKTGFGAQ